MSIQPSVSGRATRGGFTLAAALIGFSALAGAASASTPFLQEGRPKPPPILRPGSTEQKEAELTKLVRGELPKEATPEVIALWKKMIAATRTRVEGQVETPVRQVDSFRLTFDLNWRNGTQTNFIPAAQLSFLKPGYLRTTLESGRQLLRGPDGDFLLDGKDVVPIEGREAAQDRKQLDDTIRIAKNFLSLTDPNTLRLKELKPSTPPAGLPKSHADEAAKLDWIQIQSPDFYLLRSDGPAARPLFGSASNSRMYGARLGLDKTTGLIRQAEIVHLRETGEPREAPLFISLEKFFSQDGFKIPERLHVYDVESGSARRGYLYKKKETSALYLKRRIENGLSLNPGLKPEDFLPPAAESK